MTATYEKDVVNNNAIRTDGDAYLSLAELSAYSGMSTRKLREFLNDPIHPLPHYRPGGKVFVRRSEFDHWMMQFRHEGADVVQLVSDIVKEVKK